MSKLYSTRTGARALGVKQNTMVVYAIKYGIGSQPGGPGTPRMFTLDDLREIRRKRSSGPRLVKEYVEEGEDRDELELGPLYNDDATPRS